MAKVSKNALRLAGFLLAHATWIISDLGPDEAYVPQALCLKDGELELTVFEADTQTEAVSKGKDFIETQSANYEGCAFARDGLVRTDDGAIDVLSIEMSDATGTTVLTLLQPYTKQDDLRLLGPETLLSSAGTVLEDPAASALRPAIHKGARSHPRALESWNLLDSLRLPSPGLF